MTGSEIKPSQRDQRAEDQFKTGMKVEISTLHLFGVKAREETSRLGELNGWTDWR